jgi:hypothetical protein
LKPRLVARRLDVPEGIDKEVGGGIIPSVRMLSP